MKNIILKLNKIIFHWYYKRVNVFFHQWTFIKSVKLLISNYKQQEYVLKSKDELIGKFIEIDRETQKELHSLRIQQIATPEEIKWANKTLGTDYKLPEEN
jgi:hypothetical protein